MSSIYYGAMASWQSSGYPIEPGAGYGGTAGSVPRRDQPGFFGRNYGPKYGRGPATLPHPLPVPEWVLAKCFLLPLWERQDLLWKRLRNLLWKRLPIKTLLWKRVDPLQNTVWFWWGVAHHGFCCPNTKSAVRTSKSDVGTCIICERSTVRSQRQNR